MNEPKRTILGLVELVLRVEDLEAAEEFYVETVGLTRHSGLPGITFLTVAETDSPLRHGNHPQMLGLVDRSIHTGSRLEYEPIAMSRSSLDHFAFEIDIADFESEKKRLEGLGLEVLETIFPNTSARAMFFSDPEGNRIEFIAYDEALSKVRENT